MIRFRFSCLERRGKRHIQGTVSVIRSHVWVLETAAGNGADSAWLGSVRRDEAETRKEREIPRGEFGRRDCGRRWWLQKPFHGLSFSLSLSMTRRIRVTRNRGEKWITCASVLNIFDFFVNYAYVFDSFILFLR